MARTTLEAAVHAPGTTSNSIEGMFCDLASYSGFVYFLMILYLMDLAIQEGVLSPDSLPEEESPDSVLLVTSKTVNEFDARVAVNHLTLSF